MELLCNSPFGSVAGYNLDEGKTFPIRQVDQEENAAYEAFVGPFQNGVLIAARHWQSYVERYVVSSSEVRTVALSLWDTLRQAPGVRLVDLYLRTPHNDIFGYGDTFKKNHFPTLATIFLSPFLRTKRHELIQFVRRVQWTQAIAQANELGRFHRSMLLTIFRFAHFIKRMSLKLKQAKRILFSVK
jgi:hypothetical protein